MMVKMHNVPVSEEEMKLLIMLLGKSVDRDDLREEYSHDELATAGHLYRSLESNYGKPEPTPEEMVDFLAEHFHKQQVALPLNTIAIKNLFHQHVYDVENDLDRIVDDYRNIQEVLRKVEAKKEEDIE